MENIKLTEATHELFKRFANEAGDWAGCPLLDITDSERGNLSDLKKKGLLTTIKDDDNVLVTWVNFTESGLKYIYDNFNLTREDLNFYF